MNGAQDLGGMHGFGPVLHELAEPLFHAAWEARVLAMTLAMGATGQWNIDRSRAARESLPPVRYLSSSYYEIWFEGLTQLLVEARLVTADEIEDGKSRTASAPNVKVLRRDQVAGVLARGSPSDREVGTAPRFAAGDTVRTRQINPPTHTRLPRYCRGKQGCIVAVHGAHRFPDTHAIGRGEQPQWLYTVRFDAAELWGPDTSAASVCVDCWESYLEPRDRIERDPATLP